MNVSFPIPQPNSQEQKRLVPEIKTFSARQLKEDLDHLILTLNELHPASPNTGIFYPQWEFEDLHRHLDNPMTRIDFCRLVAPRIARLRDGHTWLGWEEIPELKSFDRQPAEHFPIRVKLKRSGIYIDEDCPEDPQVRKENKITKINGIGSSTIATRIRSYSNFEFEIRIRPQSSCRRSFQTASLAGIRTSTSIRSGNSGWQQKTNHQMQSSPLSGPSKK